MGGGFNVLLVWLVPRFLHVLWPSFDDTDRNQDGFIDQHEFTQRVGASYIGRFREYDENGDGKLSPEEFAKIPARFHLTQQSLGKKDRRLKLWKKDNKSHSCCIS